MPQLYRSVATENIDSYMHDIQAYDRISVAEENRLAEIIRTGAPDAVQAAKDRLICANLKLVVKIAHDFKHMGLGFADLVAEGNTGLIVAANRFDPSKGAKFSCYSSWWIKQAMRKAVAWQSRTIRIPSGSAQRIANIDKAATAFMLENGRQPTAEELARITGYTEDQVESLSGIALETLSMCDPVNEDSSTTFDQMLSETVEDESVGVRERNATINAVVGGMSDLDRTIVYRTYGFDCPRCDSRTLAQELGMSVSAVAERLSGILDGMRANACLCR